MPEEPPAALPADATPAKSNMKGCGLGCLGMVVAVIALAVACTASGGGGGGDDRPPSDYEAEVQCQDWLKEQLKAPSTAKFSGTVSTGGPTAWQVSGTVDAQNSFGAMLRSTWSCAIRLDGDTWRGSATLNE